MIYTDEMINNMNHDELIDLCRRQRTLIDANNLSSQLSDNYQEDPNNINKYSWQTIQKMVRRGDVRKYFKLGDYLKVWYKGGYHQAQIVSFDTETIASDAEHSMTLLFEHSVEFLPYAEISPELYDTEQYPSFYPDYGKSNIHEFLNCHDKKNKANKKLSNNEDYAFNSFTDGFIHNLDTDFYNVIANTNILYKYSNEGYYARVCDKFYLPSVENITNTSDDYIKTFELYKEDSNRYSGYMMTYVSGTIGRRKEPLLVPTFKELLRDEDFSSNNFVRHTSYLDLDNFIYRGCPCDWYGIRPCCNIA